MFLFCKGQCSNDEYYVIEVINKLGDGRYKILYSNTAWVNIMLSRGKTPYLSKMYAEEDCTIRTYPTLENLIKKHFIEIL